MIDSKKIVEKLRGEADRASKTLFLSKSVFKEFESYCDDLAPSRVIEELMRAFIESRKDSRPKAIKPKKRSQKIS